jgi:hypothetical protein
MNKYFRSIPKIAGRRFASTTPSSLINTNQYFAASMNKVAGQHYSLNFSYDSNHPVAISLKVSDKVGHLRQELNRVLSTSDVQIFSIDKIEIANETILSDIEFEQIYVYSAKQNLLIRVKKPFAKKETHKWEKCPLISDRKEFESLHLPYLYEKTILNYLNRLSIDKGTITTDELIRELVSKTPNSRISPSMSIVDIDKEFETLFEEYQRLETTRTDASRKGQWFARGVLLLGLGLLGGQIALVVLGVYVYYNWDIMEPIMYFLQYAGVLAIGSLFFLTRSKYENQRFAQWLTQWYQRRYLNRIRFDFNRYDQVVKLLKENHQHRLKNILNDF